MKNKNVAKEYQELFTHHFNQWPRDRKSALLKHLSIIGQKINNVLPLSANDRHELFDLMDFEDQQINFERSVGEDSSSRVANKLLNVVNPTVLNALFSVSKGTLTAIKANEESISSSFQEDIKENYNELLVVLKIGSVDKPKPHNATKKVVGDLYRANKEVQLQKNLVLKNKRIRELYNSYNTRYKLSYQNIVDAAFTARISISLNAVKGFFEQKADIMDKKTIRVVNILSQVFESKYFQKWIEKVELFEKQRLELVDLFEKGSFTAGNVKRVGDFLAIFLNQNSIKAVFAKNGEYGKSRARIKNTQQVYDIINSLEFKEFLKTKLLPKKELKAINKTNLKLSHNLLLKEYEIVNNSNEFDASLLESKASQFGILLKYPTLRAILSKKGAYRFCKINPLNLKRFSELLSHIKTEMVAS